MTTFDWVVLATTCGLFVYLLFAMLFPERLT
ncbi:MAG: potassium transporter TrkH [Pirellula sp.]|nr:potassium transporter TrkH [Pirellula sp.]